MAEPHRQPVNISWSLDTTASNTVTVASGIIRAATSDNVQVLALGACELYGATLAMCPSICTRVEELAKVRYTSHVIEHFAAVIGWSAGDSADQLASTDAGCLWAISYLEYNADFTAGRFLALVPPLLTLGGPFKAAQALHGFLKMSSAESQLLPTLHQLRDLIFKVQPKLMRAGFTENYLVSWHIWLTSEVSGFKTLFTAQLDPQPYTDAIRELPVAVDRGLVQPAYPPGSIVFDLVRALAELERLGEATFLIVRTPACIATWIIAFVDWCLGIKPIVRGLAHDEEQTKEIVHHRESKVLIEVFPTSADLRKPNIVTFKKMGSLDKLLSENQSFFKTQQPWTGMVKASTYFQTRIHDLQTFHGLFNIVDSLTMLIRDLTDRFQTSESPFPHFSSKPFPESDKLLRLLWRLLTDDHNSKHKLILPSSQDVQAVWKGREYKDVAKVAELFEEFLIASLFENLHMDDEIDVYFSQRWKGWKVPSSPLLRLIIAHLQGQLELTQTLVISSTTIDHMMLELTGGWSGSGKPLIASSKGQVSYSSFIENMELDGRCMGARRVYPGLLRFEGQTYDYARSEDNTKLFDTLNISKISSQDFSSEPFRAPNRLFDEADSTWLGSAQEHHMSFYFVPSLEQRLSLNPLLFFEASEGLSFMQGCRVPQCAPKPRQNEVLYCRTIAAALSPTKPQAIRVLSSWGRRAHSLFVKAALAELWLNQDEPFGFPVHNAFTVVRGSSCQACACAEGLESLQSFTETGVKTILIVLD
jgi:hypothetical protein